MELLGQKGADLLNGTLQDVTPKTKGSAAVPMVRAELSVTVLAVGIVFVGVYLCFRDLALTGLTWDEWMDYSIARDFVQNQSFLTNHDDPSQARLSHLLAAASFALLGESYFAFKLPFVLAGLLGGAALWRFLSSQVRPVVAVLAAAMYFTCPYVLAASRTGATAGDALVLVTTMGFVITLYRWIQTNRFFPYGLACGIVCGLGIGAKWTNAVWFGSVGLAWLFEIRRQRRRLFDGPVWAGVLAHQWVAVALAFFASPTLMLGYVFVKNALNHSLMFTGMALLQFGKLRAQAPWYYIPAVLVAKFAIPQLIVFGYELLLMLVLWAKPRRKLGLLPVICLLSMFPMVPLATKGFQNAHYYLGSVPAVMILSALAIERWLRRRSALGRRLILALAALTATAQLGTAIWLSPDYLLAGRQFGKFFYSQFSGPVVNHCQGLPFALREMNRLIGEPEAPKRAHLLRSCLGVMDHAIAHGPVVSLIPVTPYPTTGAKWEHFLIIPGSFDYDNLGEAEQQRFTTMKETATADCNRVGRHSEDFELWWCPAR